MFLHNSIICCLLIPAMKMQQPAWEHTALLQLIRAEDAEKGNLIF